MSERKELPHAMNIDMIAEWQSVWWNQMDDGSTMELELIDWFNAPRRSVGKGHHYIFYAIAASDYAKMGIKAGDNLKFFMSYVMFGYALREIPKEMKTPLKPQYCEGKNVLIKFTKKNMRSVTIHSIEPREPTEQHLTDAKKFYEIIRLEHKVL